MHRCVWRETVSHAGKLFDSYSNCLTSSTCLLLLVKKKKFVKTLEITLFKEIVGWGL